MYRPYPTLLCTGVALLTTASPAFADDVHCPPDLGAVTIDGNVLVAAPCRLDGTTVIGNVELYTGGSLIARGARIHGNIQAGLADFVDVAGSSIGGSIQLDELVGDSSSIVDNAIDGNIQLVGNRSAFEVAQNTVGADIQAFSNSGALTISDNRVDGNLQCKENTPAPTGGNNDVQGNKEDQCASLAGGAASPASSASNNAGPAVSTSPALASSAAQESAGTGGGGAIGTLGLVLLATAGGWRRRRAAAASPIS